MHMFSNISLKPFFYKRNISNVDKLKSKKIFSQNDRNKVRKQFEKDKKEDNYNCSCCEITIKALDALDAVENQATDVMKVNLQLRAELVAAKNVMSRSIKNKEEIVITIKAKLSKQEINLTKEWIKTL